MTLGLSRMREVAPPTPWLPRLRDTTAGNTAPLGGGRDLDDLTAGYPDDQVLSVPPLCVGLVHCVSRSDTLGPVERDVNGGLKAQDCRDVGFVPQALRLHQ